VIQVYFAITVILSLIGWTELALTPMEGGGAVSCLLHPAPEAAA
jgi:hypothetical protein